MDAFTRSLIDDFDAAAQAWGWQRDQGYGAAANKAERDWRTAREVLLDHLQQRPERLKITNDGVAAVDPDYFYRSMDTCPVGKKVLLLTMHGVAVLAEWKRTDTDIVAWSPLPKRRPA